MIRFLATLFTVAVLAGVARADIPPPPPPKGKKYASVSNEVVVGKDVTGYVFVQALGAGPGAPRFTYSEVEFTPGKAKAMPLIGRHTYLTLYAVPQDAAKEFKTTEELCRAVRTNKVKGALSIEFTDTTTVPSTLNGDSVRWTYTITLDEKGGVKSKVDGEGVRPSNDKSGKDSPEDDSDSAVGQTPRGGAWVADAAAGAAIMLGGLWLAGRTRRKL